MISTRWRRHGRRRGQHAQLEKVFATIEERARHLEAIIQGYARFAKLPAPQPAPIAWPELVEGLRNAHESGSPPKDVRMRVRKLPGSVSIEVADRGTGMNEAVLSHALLPFYSTKRGGTGLGLALVREIAEAHGGRVALANRDGGGVSITVVLPQ